MSSRSATTLTRVDRLASVVLLIGALLYLVRFVDRGWLPPDEGMLGQTAERVLQGDLPHADFEEPYTGGLSWGYALVFRVAGIDLVNVRWVLFAGAVLAVAAMHGVLRWFLPPIHAATLVWLGLVWSFPNYFAGLPSWWLLICALVGLWSMLRYLDSGNAWALCAAALAAGIAIAIKQTGVYLLVALGMAVLFEGRPIPSTSGFLSISRLLRIGAGIAAVAFALVIVWRGLDVAGAAYLLVPIVACSIALARSSDQLEARPWSLTSLAAASACASLPMVLLLAPYVREGKLWEFFDGVVVQPQARFAFASLPMPAAPLLLTGIPLVGMLWPGRATFIPASRAAAGSLWLVGLAWPIAALWNESLYQLLWQSVRAFGALLPVAICWQLPRVDDTATRRQLFLLASVLAWMSLNQFPFAGPTYFCYVAPIVLAAAVALYASQRTPPSPALFPWMAALMVFGLLCLNRDYTYNNGKRHRPARFNTPLGQERASFLVVASQADVYKRLMNLVTTHRGGGTIAAGPDAPEIQFLAGVRNPSGKLFEFIGRERDGSDSAQPALEWLQASVVVINHRPWFSPPMSEPVLHTLRDAFPLSETVGDFEVRWRR